MDFIGARDFIINKLKNELRPDLYYHCYKHTIDVYVAAKKFGKMEKIGEVEYLLLLTAALYHDSGFLIGYKNHEELSIEFSKQHLPSFGYTVEEIDIVCEMITATRLPQNPKTHLEKILCDSDLDYLGRDDFFLIANKLLCEWNLNGISTTLKEWYNVQADFLIENNYFTNSAILLRKEMKIKNLNQILELLKN